MRSLTTTIAIVALTTLTGCTAVSLDRHTTNQMISSSDLRYQIVLDCLASTAANRGQIPSFSTVTDAVTQVQDVGKFESKMTIPSLGPVFTLTGTRSPEALWTLDPAAEPEKLQAIHAACKWVLYDCHLTSDEQTTLKKYQVYRNLQSLPGDWLGCGCKCDVPKNACYTAHCCDRYVWVSPAGTGCLSEFTLIIMDIATTDPRSLDATATVTFTVDADNPFYPFAQPAGWYKAGGAGYPIVVPPSGDAMGKGRVVQTTVGVDPDATKLEKLAIKQIDLWDARSMKPRTDLSPPQKWALDNIPLPPRLEPTVPQYNKDLRSMQQRQ